MHTIASLLLQTPVPSSWARRCRIITATMATAAALLLAVDAGAADASLDVGDFAIDTTTRTLPAILNRGVDIGAFSFTGNTGCLSISVNVGSSGWSVAKRYVIPMRYNLTGISAANTWLKVLPTHDTGAYGANNFDLDIKVTQGVMNVRLRVSGTDGSKVGTANAVIESAGVNVITYSTANAGVVPPTAAQVYAGNVLTQIAGRVGVNTVPSTDAALDVNGGNTMGLRLRPRTVAGAPASGAWFKGTLIVDSTGTLYVCTADGTPGTWKKVGL